jgi:BirA family biotin operon repressor/biotin-[acetyl-CoA-carboxylase] ligase
MNIIYLEEVNSTNTYAKENLDNLADRTVIAAKRQTAGRGQFGRRWVDFGAGNLFISIVLKPSDSFKPEYSGITLLAAQALCSVLEGYGLEPAVKHPNDILINGKKIAGILCETATRGDKFKGLVLGMGVNLNAAAADLPKVEDQKTTALNIELSRAVDCDVFLDKLLIELFNITKL